MTLRHPWICPFLRLCRSYEALAELHQAQVAREAGENGPEVARLRKAAELAGAAGRTARATGDSKLQDACNRIAQDVTAGLNR